jgi:hypothetical protein
MRKEISMNNTGPVAIVGRNSDTPVSMSSGRLTVGPNTQVGWADVSSHWWPEPQRYIPWSPPITTHHYTTTSIRPNATEMAFKIVSKLMEEGLVEDLSVKRFVKLVDEVAKIVKAS